MEQRHFCTKTSTNSWETLGALGPKPAHGHALNRRALAHSCILDTYSIPQHHTCCCGVFPMLCLLLPSTLYA